MTQILKAGGVRSAIVEDWDTFCGLVVEKLLWSSIFWLLSAAMGAKPVRAFQTCLNNIGARVFELSHTSPSAAAVALAVDEYAVAQEPSIAQREGPVFNTGSVDARCSSWKYGLHVHLRVHDSRACSIRLSNDSGPQISNCTKPVMDACSALSDR